MTSDNFASPASIPARWQNSSHKRAGAFEHNSRLRDLSSSMEQLADPARWPVEADDVALKANYERVLECESPWLLLAVDAGAGHA
jgi:hypothetical protein